MDSFAFVIVTFGHVDIFRVALLNIIRDVTAEGQINADMFCQMHAIYPDIGDLIRAFEFDGYFPMYVRHRQGKTFAIPVDALIIRFAKMAQGEYFGRVGGAEQPAILYPQMFCFVLHHCVSRFWIID